MGQRRVWLPTSADEQRAVSGALLRDLEALEWMLAEGRIESGARRIGAEQEMFLIDSNGAPAPVGPAVLEAVADSRITSELGAFNLEANTPPLEWGETVLSELEGQLRDILSVLSPHVEAAGARALLCGILPTLRPESLTRDNMTPAARYYALEDALRAARGEHYRVFIKGADELAVEHDSAMLEACNTSFQLHLQVDPEDFANDYNLTLVSVAPLLAAAANSPLLFGRRLWHETRIALFQQAVDTRPVSGGHRNYAPRVHFGETWVESSITELFHEDIGRFRPLLATDPGPDPRKQVREGQCPSLSTLQVFNGTVYRWVRPCYGVSDGTAHVRIENRVLPAGPTVLDEVANAAFWYGMMQALRERHSRVRDEVCFATARGNFTAAARLGLSAPLEWFGRDIQARDLILGELLPLAHEGLSALGTADGDRRRYLGVIEARVASGRTGAVWQLKSLETFSSSGREALGALTEAMFIGQSTSAPAHEWPLASLGPRGPRARMNGRVGGFMSTDLVTVRAGDPAALPLRLMEWRRVRHIPVEDSGSRLVGILTRGDLFRALAADGPDGLAERSVAQLMIRDPITIEPRDRLNTALSRMREHGVSALPVVEAGRLVGLVTERDFLRLAGELLTQEPEKEEA